MVSFWHVALAIGALMFLWWLVSVLWEVFGPEPRHIREYRAATAQRDYAIQEIQQIAADAQHEMRRAMAEGLARRNGSSW
jgi:uncharacterized membrane-anchored protein